jgi:predicted nuclease of predicted toxin-antitoxin system
MRFLLNMNVPRELGTRLTTEGHEFRHVGDIGMARANDIAIVQKARRNGEVIVTHDLEYGRILYFDAEARCSVVIFRVRNTLTENLFSRLMSSWMEIEKPLAEGAIVVLEDAALRVRRPASA